MRRNQRSAPAHASENASSSLSASTARRKLALRGLFLVLGIAMISALAIAGDFELRSASPVIAQDAPALQPDAAQAVGQGLPAELIRYPDVSQTQICFVFGGDIWVMPKSGGLAHRLTSADGEESFPRFSDDGSMIAFTGNYDGNSDVYVVPVSGGAPRRLTWHADSDRVVNWSADGQVMFASIRTSPTGRVSQLFKISPTGGDAHAYPMPYADFGAETPNGNMIAYVPWSRDFRTWKRYRGGMAPDIWLYHLEQNQAANISQSDANESQPMWHGGKLYFLSDRGEDKRMNIWRYDPSDKSFAQITHSTEYDIHFPAIGPSEMVLARRGRLYLMDMQSHELKHVEARVVYDQTQTRERSVKAEDYIDHVGISPTGKRAVLSARGQLITLPAKHGVMRNIDGDSTKADRHPEYSPNGEWIACFSDRSGEYELWLVDPKNQNSPRQISNLGAGYRYRVNWSPDSKWVAFIDSTMTLQMINVETREHREIDKGLWMYQWSLANFRVSWSADSKWIAYSRGLDNQHEAVFLYNVASKVRTRVTSGYYSDRDPAFDPEGKYLYYLSNREITPIYSDLDNTWIYPNTTQVMAASLRADVKSPLAPRNDEESGADESDDADESDGAEEESVAPQAIELDGLESRAVVLPMTAGNYSHLAAIRGKLFVLRHPRTGADDKENELIAWDLKSRKESTTAEKVNSYELAAGGKHLLVRSGKNYTIMKSGARGGGGGRGKRGGDEGEPRNEWESDDGPAKLDFSKLELTVNPRAEWQQIFSDAWRIERDFFYDPNLHGVDWAAMRERYGSLVAACSTRWDLDYLLGELIGELNASHTYRWGGDQKNAESRNVGSLGADVRIESFETQGAAMAAYQIKHILRTAAWDADARSPLDQPGLDVKEGDVILAINGEKLDARFEFASHLQGMAGATIELRVADDVQGTNTRDLLVQLIGGDNRLRYLEWVEDRRKYVERKTGGTVGYVYVPNTGRDGQNELVRQYRAQYTMPGMIIDERFNGGGQLPDRFVELLARKSLNRWGVRDGRDWVAPSVYHDGPKAMLINGRAGSGGDAFPWYFKQAGLGPLIGSRTWGGLIGITGCPNLIDGGTIFAPTFGIYDNDGNWIIEGYGVDPDIPVIDDPAAHVRGEDPQLDAAIAHVLSELKANPPKQTPKPQYPDRSK